MATTVSTSRGLMTFAQFEQMPDEECRYELRHGEPVKLSHPFHEHYRIQLQLRDLLAAAAGSEGKVGMEWGFRPTGEYEYRVADVAFLSQKRYDAITRYLMGSPELVAEVISPSNTRAEISDKEKLCLENGCLEFWVIDPKRRTVMVSTPDGHTQTYLAGQQIPLMFGGELAVDAIFE
jgi:Uma2 family endonuclease